MNILKNANVIKNFKLINTDEVNVPPQITEVPTLIVQQVGKPLMGKEAFAWANGLVNMNKMNQINTNNNNNNNNSSMQQNNKKIFIMQQLQNMNKNKNDPNGLNMNNQFTAIGNNTHDDPEMNCTNPNDKTTFMYTAPELKDKIDKEAQEKAIDNLENERKKQDDGYKEYLKKFQ
jgi:hypothetical protein